MVFFGNSAGTIATTLVQEKCPFCGAQNSVRVTISQVYVQVLFIPLFPFGKTGTCTCGKCHHTFVKANEMPPAILRSYNEILMRSKAPVWIYSGFVIAMGILLLGMTIPVRSIRQHSHSTEQEIDQFEQQHIVYKPASVKPVAIEALAGEYPWVAASSPEKPQKKRNEAYLFETDIYTKSELCRVLYP